jgi:hypothetical protein
MEWNHGMEWNGMESWNGMEWNHGIMESGMYYNIYNIYTNNYYR